MIPADRVARDDHRFALISAAEAVEPPIVVLCDYAPNVSHPTSEAKKNPGRMMLRGLSVRISCHPDITASRLIFLFDPPVKPLVAGERRGLRTAGSESFR